MTRQSRRIDSPTDKGKWLDGKRACEFIGKSSSTLARWVDAGIITYKLRRTAHGFKKMYNTAEMARALEPKTLSQHNANN